MKHSIWTHCTGIVKACHWWVAAGLLVALFGLAVTAMSGNSAIVDEVAHISAGYSYLHYHDYRLNPEHPPLMKVLAAVPLQFMHLKFPVNQPDWTTEINGEWDVGYDFLYHLGNSASRILFWARLPILLVATAFGAVFYWLLKRRYGIAVALLALFFYVFSPNILANADLVTTDLGAAIFIFLALVAFAAFVRRPSRRMIWVLGLALAGAQLAKFSGIILYPFLGGILIVLAILEYRGGHQATVRRLVSGYILASLISLVLVYLAYLPFVWNMSVGAQQQLILSSLPHQPSITTPLTHLAALPGGKPLTQFLLGVSMVSGRYAGGNVTYLLGQVRNGSFWDYFPILFLIKTQVSFLILLAITTVMAAVVAWRRRRQLTWVTARSWAKQYVFELTLGLFVVVYMGVAMSGNLDIGIRHILPIYLPLFALVALGVTWIMRHLLAGRSWRPTVSWILGGLLIWYVGATLWIYPSFLSYFNELIGGPSHAGQYVSDSNVDWGQDLVRFQTYLTDHPEIKTVALDYFGGAYPQYYFCNRLYTSSGQLVANSSGYDCSHSRVIFWHSNDGPYPGQYIAVSETYLENDRYYAAQVHLSGYAYLRARKPIARIGYSIYLYKLY